MNIKESIRRIIKEETEMLFFIFNPKTNKVIGFNLTYNSEEFNNIRYDENGRSRDYGFGPQKDDFGDTIKFDSLEDVQKWYSDKTEKHLQKQTQNQKYPDLSYIANSIRKIDGLDYQVINRGSCFKFAKEISKLGYNKFTFIFSEEEQEVIHVYVKLTNNLYFDANGFHTKKEIKNEYYVGEDTEMYESSIDELDNFSDLNTYECLTTIPISNDVWKKVIQIIKQSRMNLQENIRRIIKEETEGIDTFLDEISNKYDLSDELKTFIKEFIQDSNCKRINFSNFKIGALGMALESGVLINSKVLERPLPFMLFVILHEVAHQYQFKKYGVDVMYNCYLGDVSVKEAAEFMKTTEEVADEFASRKIRQLQKKGLIGSFTSPQVYKNMPLQNIIMMINNIKNDMKRQNIDSPKKVSEYFYNMVKSEL